MPRGYAGKMLWVNLTRQEVQARDLDEDLVRKYIGGAGLAAKILWDGTTAQTTPLSPENRLIFMTGPLTATAAPWSARHIVVALSTATGIYGEAHSGGAWGDELKRAGVDGIVISGKADNPVYLWLKDGEAEGIPTEKKLVELGLGDVAEAFPMVKRVTTEYG